MMQPIPHLGFVARPVLQRRNNTYMQCTVCWKNKGRVRNRVSLADPDYHNQNWFLGEEKTDIMQLASCIDPCLRACRLYPTTAGTCSNSRGDEAGLPPLHTLHMRTFCYSRAPHSSTSRLSLLPCRSSKQERLHRNQCLDGEFCLAATCCQTAEEGKNRSTLSAGSFQEAG